MSRREQGIERIGVDTIVEWACQRQRVDAFGSRESVDDAFRNRSSAVFSLGRLNAT